MTGALVAVIAVCDLTVTHSVGAQVYSRVEDVPRNEYGLVLGTSPVSYWSGRRNLYFDARMRGAAALYHAGKVQRLVVSGGDYRNEGKFGYDEPACMRDSLIALGVDSVDIILDYDGTRTIKSIENMPTKYHAGTFTVISQEYHNERALFQANAKGLNAVAFNAVTPDIKESWLRNRGREALARVKLFFDLYILAPLR